MSWESASTADLMVALQGVASVGAARFGLRPIRSPGFLRLGENASFVVESLDSRTFLRIHRPGYHSEGAIRSELSWLEALRAAGLRVPQAIPGLGGEFVQTLESTQLGPHHATLFQWIEGSPPSDDAGASTATFRLLGRAMALLHEASRAWKPPRGFERHSWNRDGIAGRTKANQPVWGFVHRDSEWAAEDLEALDRVQDRVDSRLASFPTDAEHFGLIHADLQAGNLLLDEDGTPTLLDFDDGGFGWYAYDFASSLWLLEEHVRYAEFRDAMLAGYSEVTTVPSLAERELPTFLMARRLAWLSWVHSRAHTPHARDHREERGRAIRRALHRYLETHDV